MWRRFLAGGPRWPSALPLPILRAKPAGAAYREFPHAKPLKDSSHRVRLSTIWIKRFTLNSYMLHRRERERYGLFPYHHRGKDPIRDSVGLRTVARMLLVDRYQALSNGEADQPG